MKRKTYPERVRSALFHAIKKMNRDVKKLKKGLTAALPYVILSIVPSAKALNRWGFSSAGSPVEAVNNPRTN